MYRRIIESLKEWKESSFRSPLILCGARQVGKTYAMKQFGSRYFDRFAYIDLMKDEAKRVFSAGYDPAKVLENIELYTKVKIEAGKTLVIIDEIQEVSGALALMKGFKEDFPDIALMTAGSYLGTAYHAGQSFPVGKVELLDMYPMSFLEFLIAMGEEALAGKIVQLDFEALASFDERLNRLVRKYYYVGGMPEAVLRFRDGGEDYRAARRVQRLLLAEYDRDFSKHIKNERELERVRLAFSSIPAHLGRENHKFIFGHIAKGARSRDYETAIQWIVNSGLATRVYRVDKLATPLAFYRDLSAFKLYLPDVGLLGCAMEIEAKDVLLSDKGLAEYKGAMTEQYACQQLVAAGCAPYYWSASAGTGEIDFVVRHQSEAAPLEVKAAENLQAKSLRMVCERTGLHGFRSSMAGYREQDWMTNVPLWALEAYFREDDGMDEQPY